MNKLASQSTIEIGGKTYLAGKATVSDLASLAMRAKKYLASPLTQLTQDPGWKLLSPDQQMELIKQLGPSQEFSPVDLFKAGKLFDALTIPQVLAFFLWLVLRHNHPDVTIDALLAEVNETTAPVLAVQVMEAVDFSTGDDEVDRKNGTSQPG
jgi:hypothetical protein